MAAKTLQAKRFARAIFEIASENNELDKWQFELQELARLASDPGFVAVMENPKYNPEAKDKLLASQANLLSPVALNLAKLLTQRGTFGLVTDVFREYVELVNQLKGIEKAEVVTAVELDESQKARLVRQLGEITGKKIDLSLKVEPTILGGMVVRVGGKLIDGSTSSQLLSLKSDLANAGT